MVDPAPLVGVYRTTSTLTSIFGENTGQREHRPEGNGHSADGLGTPKVALRYSDFTFSCIEMGVYGIEIEVIMVKRTLTSGKRGCFV